LSGSIIGLDVSVYMKGLSNKNNLIATEKYNLKGKTESLYINQISLELIKTETI